MTEIKLTLEGESTPRWLALNLRARARFMDTISAGATAKSLRHLADSIEEQIKPPVEEPAEWGSVVLASSDACHNRVHWFRDHNFWRASLDGHCSGWSYLHNPEVLRVGIGEPAAKSKETLSAYDEGYGNGQYTGFDQALGAAYEQIAALRAEAITAERKDAYDKALRIIHELRP